MCNFMDGFLIGFWSFPVTFMILFWFVTILVRLINNKKDVRK
jgi:hypothetical protein